MTSPDPQPVSTAIFDLNDFPLGVSSVAGRQKVASISILQPKLDFIFCRASDYYLERQRIHQDC
jgi:hypothetical protein